MQKRSPFEYLVSAMTAHFRQAQTTFAATNSRIEFHEKKRLSRDSTISGCERLFRRDEVPIESPYDV
jgi:hypothetical protein